MAKATADPVAQLIAATAKDPLRFVLRAYDWGVGELEGKDGPREWQALVLSDLRDHLQGPTARSEPFLAAVASGHGIGKSATVAWLIDWAMSTCVDCKVVVTANTEPQLRTKTWPELLKWHGLSINSDWFRPAATALHAVGKCEKTWRADAIPWSIHRPESFAGLHNQGKRILVIFDEASAIPDIIWEVTEGALTDEDTEIIWVCFGNPTRNTGRFRECYGRHANLWRHYRVDSRTVPGVNKAQIAKWAEAYGEDSDFFRVRVKGEFPRAGSMQFIASDIVEEAVKREAISHLHDTVIYGVDVARYGDDESVIWQRRGRDARTWPCIRMRGVDTMTLAGRVAELMTKDPGACFVDETGIGGGVIDRLRQLGFEVRGVNNGGKSDWRVEGESVANKGAEMWARMREWLRSGGAIPDVGDLRDQLTGREYGYNTHSEILLERKDDMKERGLSSPDLADALALTFAYPVGPRHAPENRAPQRAASTWHPFD